MSVIWTKDGPYRRVEYESEADLESAILEVQNELFGSDRIYLDAKRKIGAKGGQRNIPDGYLIDLNGRRPRLYVVENELAVHDPLRHVAVQILQFSISFESEQHTVKKILFEALQGQPEAKRQCEEYAKQNGFRNLDHLLETMVFEAPFSALVIIDDLQDNLEKVLAEKFKFGIEVIELARYESHGGEHLYRFEPFLADLRGDVSPDVKDAGSSYSGIDTTELDTVVVPAREGGFESVFLGESRWYSIRIHGSMRPQIKYIAAYQVAPVSAITYIAPVKSIEPWQDSGKFVVNFSESARKIGPIRFVEKSRVKALQNLRYTTLERLESAKTLDEVW